MKADAIIELAYPFCAIPTAFEFCMKKLNIGFFLFIAKTIHKCIFLKQASQIDHLGY